MGLSGGGDASEMARLRSHDVFLYAAQYGDSVGSTLIERLLRYSFYLSRRAMMGKRLLCCSLSRTTTPVLSLSPRRRKGGVRTGRRR